MLQLIFQNQNWETFTSIDSLTILNSTFYNIDSECINYWSDDLPFSSDAPVLIEHVTIYNSGSRAILLQNSNGAIVRDLILTDIISENNEYLIEMIGDGSSLSHIDTFQVSSLSFSVIGVPLITKQFMVLIHYLKMYLLATSIYYLNLCYMV